jgi:hypothetical protein
MKDFRIKVTPEESELVQKLIFLCGYSWCDGDSDVMLTEETLLDFEDNSLSYDDEICNDTFITFEEFLNIVEEELISKNR